MTREECLEAISRPGKFEGEPIYVPYFWDKMMDGCFDDEEWDGDVLITIFDVDEDDLKMFPELKDISRVKIWERDDGFAMSEAFD